MVVLLQLGLFLIALLLRGRYLFGWHLKANETNSERLDFVSKDSTGRVILRHVGYKRPSHDGLLFRIHRERWYHRLLKDIGIAAEIKVRDAAFDEKYFIMTDSPDALEKAMSSPELMAALNELFNLPVKALYAAKDRVWCVVSDSDENKRDLVFESMLVC